MYRYGLYLLILQTLVLQLRSLSSTNKELVEYTIIVTGDELLRGKYSDSHTLSITRALDPLGFRCVSSITVGDRADDLRRGLEYTARQSSLILVTGGLGPTEDDITRRVLSEFSGIPLQENRDVIAHLERRFSVEPGKLRDNIRRQGLTPVSGTYLPNPHGTAVGLVFDKEDQLIVALPGPPRELQPMLTERLVPFLTKRFGTRSPGSSLQIRFVGIGESSIDNAIQDHLVLPKDIVISSLFEAGRVDLTFSLPGNSPDEMERLKSFERQLAEQIGEYIYSDNGSTLEECVVEMLIEQRITLGLAEVGSGGAISASLNDLEGVSEVLRGGLTAASNAQLAVILGTPEMEIDETMVNRLCKMLSSRWGLIVTEPKVAEAGSRSVEVVIGSPKGILLKKQLPLRGRGENARSWLVSGTLDLLRRELEKNRSSG